MSIQTPGTAEIVVIHHPPGIKHGCKECGRIYEEGVFAVGLIVKEDGKEYRYAIGHSPAIWCCGEQKSFFQVFDDRDEAQLVCDEVRHHLNTHHSTEGLYLVSFRWADAAPPNPARVIRVGG